MTIQEIITVIFASAGALFMLISLIGLIRFPDFYTRLHAQGVGDTLGALLIIIGMAAATGLNIMSVKIFLIFAIIVLTNPIGTNLMLMAVIRHEDYLEYNQKQVVKDTAETAGSEAVGEGEK